MIRPFASGLAVLALVFAGACSSTARNGSAVKDPSLEKEYDQQNRSDEKYREYQAVLLRVDQAIESYVRLLDSAGDPAAEHDFEKVDRFLRETVDGAKVNRPGTRVRENGYHEELLVTASDASYPANQGIALAALGFSTDPKVLDVLLNGAASSDPFLIDRAVLGLAVLHDPRTPPGTLIAIFRDTKLAEETRTQAAWALYRIQEGVADRKAFYAAWEQVLGEATAPAGVMLHAIRGLGQSRDPVYGELVARFAGHPMARVRMAVALALGRMNAQKQVEVLLSLIDAAETAPNVRLCANRSLQALAGGVDRGYDVPAWRKLFQRGTAPATTEKAPGTPDK